MSRTTRNNTQKGFVKQQTTLCAIVKTRSEQCQEYTEKVIILKVLISFRLTPSLIVTMLLYNNLLPLLVTGPHKMYIRYYSKESWRHQCNSYWWSNLLYINNFWPHSFNVSVSLKYFALPIHLFICRSYHFEMRRD